MRRWRISWPTLILPENIIKQELQENGSLMTLIMCKNILKVALILNKLIMSTLQGGSHLQSPVYVANDTICKWQQAKDL